MTARVCTRDDFARAVLERGLQFPLDARNYNAIAIELGFLQVPPPPDRSEELVALEEEVARLNDAYREAVIELGRAEHAAAGITRTVVTARGYEGTRDAPAAHESSARIQAASDRIEEVRAAHRAALARLRKHQPASPSGMRALFARIVR